MVCFLVSTDWAYIIWIDLEEAQLQDINDEVWYGRESKK